MATEIKIPDIGTTVDHVTLVRWLKNEGEPVKRGEPLCEVETDKAVSELESIAEGILLKQVLPEDTEVEQGAIIAYVGKEGENVPDGDQPPSPEATQAPPEASLRRVEGQGKQKTGRKPQFGREKKTARISPLLRNLAKKEGVDLEHVTGTGPGGRITREDVMRASAPVQRIPRTVEGKPLSSNQATVARRVSQSQREIPVIDLTSRFEMTAVLQARRHLQEESNSKVSFDAFFISAVSRVMKEFPHFRSKFEEGKVIESVDCNAGIAISVGEELYTPVIKNADAKSVSEIDSAVQQLVEKAEKGCFAPEDMTGGTITVSNLGMYPVCSFCAVIPPGQVAVLSVGAIEETALVRGGKVKIIPAAMITLSVDHRLINGREAAQFLARLKEEMEKL